MGDIIFLLIMLECGNVMLGLIGYSIANNTNKGLTDFEDDHMFRVIVLGIIYWIIKLIAYPILIPYKKIKKKRETIKGYQDKLIERINNLYNDYSMRYKSVTNIQNKIEELRKSLNQDLYARASDSYNDMLHILIKCSDGKGNIDTNEFAFIITECVKECTEIVNVAYKEHESRLEKAKQQYYNNKKDEIKQDLENMKNKNKEFKTMWEEK